MERGLAAFAGVDEGEDVAAPAAGPATRSVTQFVNAVKGSLESVPGLQDTWVKGEIAQITRAASGHWYFTVKDANAQLSCVMWRGANARVPFDPEQGMDVLLCGSVSVYAARGQMQFTVREMRPDGQGALWVAFEQLRRRLAEEGLFDEDRKRHLPPFPRVIGVVTSASGAVWHDIRKVARRRFPGIHLVLAPVRVQGDGAAEEVADAIARFNAHAAADVLIVGRGGGSVEDLWAFNEEPVVRAIAGSDIPVVSAVGHETDTTLADLAADLRAATPSQAAELTVPDAVELQRALADVESRLQGALLSRVERARERYATLTAAGALTHPERWINERRQRVDDATLRLGHAIRRVVDARRATLGARAASLDALSPLGVLARGYAVTRKGDGSVVREAGDVTVDEDVEVVVHRGRFRARVTDVTQEESE